MSGVDLLVTGFGPFPGVRVNPTDSLAREIGRDPAWRRLGLTVAVEVLHVSYGRGLGELREALRRHDPRAVLLLGVASRARKVRVERYGRVDASRLHPDASGAVGASSAIRSPRSPLATTRPPERALACLAARGVRARVSESAGRYLCNAAYAEALGWAAPRHRRALFVHVPRLEPSAGVTPLARLRGPNVRRAPLLTGLRAAARDLARRF